MVQQGSQACPSMSGSSGKTGGWGNVRQSIVRPPRLDQWPLDVVFEATRAKRGHARFIRHPFPSPKRVWRSTTFDGACIEPVDARLLSADRQLTC